MARKTSAEKPEYSGSFLTFEPARTTKIRESLRYPGEASEAFSAVDWDLERREIALLSLTPGEASIDAVVLMDRMHGSGGTGKCKRRMWSPIMVERSIEPHEIADAFPAADRLCTAQTFRRIPYNEWQLVLEAIKRVRPNLKDRLENLVSLRGERTALTGHDARILRLSEQRDALGLMLDIASLDRKAILRGAKFSQIGAATSVLDLLDHQLLQEQDLIWRDLNVFQSLLSTQQVRSGRFVGPGAREVRVHVYDKKPLETVLGIDLLIYMADFESYLLIQYKSMQPKSDSQGRTWSYLVDEQIRCQIGAMDRAVAAIAQQSASVALSMKHWRLTDEVFYFKFCETTRPNARDDALVAGLTLGHSHLKRFLELPEAQGQHGGYRVGYSNCPRYLNNTQFVELAREGWIGCDRRGFEFVSAVIEAGLESGRSAMLAVIEGSGAQTSYDRRKYLR